jgi:hypothetical protein
MIHSLVLRLGTCPLRDQKGDAVGRASRQSRFLGDPNAKFFCEKALVSENPPLTRRVESTSQSQSSPAMDVGEGAHTRRPFPYDPILASNAERQKTFGNIFQ